jgi:hypothetical protein
MLNILRSGSKRTKAVWWLITIATVFTFLIGFSFFGGLGRDPNWAARQSGSYGSVNGDKITKEQWDVALETEKATYRQRFGTDPVDRDLRAVEQQAWRGLVNSRLLEQAGLKAGYKATDNEVLATMMIDPPPIIQLSPALQTDGKFDPAKWAQLRSNPQQNWTPYEDQVREEWPGKKLQEVALTSAKFSEAELHEAFDAHFERLQAVIVAVPPADSGSSSGSEAELAAAYQKYRPLLASPARTQLEYLAVPVQYTEEEIRTAMDVANGLYQRLNKGEAFDQLCRDYSEGLNAEHGGVIDRFINPAEMGPAGQPLATAKPGAILPPLREGGSVMIFRVLNPAVDSLARNAPAGQIKLAQILVKVHPGQDGLRTQYQRVADIAKRAKAVGLSRAATEKGLATQKTSFFDLVNMPQQLYSTPEAADWGLTHKKGDVSPVFESADEFVVAQVAVQSPAGVPPRAEVADQLKQIADFDHRVELSKTRADQVAAALHGGATLEAAATAAGLTAMPVTLTREQADPRVARASEFVGALWAAKTHPGQVVGPVRCAVGYYFGRVVSLQSPPDSLWANPNVRNQLSTDLVQRRQNATMQGLVVLLRQGSKIADNRSPSGP